MQNKYKPYEPSELSTIFNETWEISDRPYMLHAAFALHALYDLICDTEREEDEDDYIYNKDKNINRSTDQIWGKKLLKKTVDRLVKELKDDFNDAASYRKPIVVNERRYSIRKVNAYDHSRLDYIFNFPLEGDEYVIVPDGVLNLSGIPYRGLDDYRVTPDELKENRTFLRKVVAMAEDDGNNGWEKLTDMEIIVYCWSLFYNKHQYDNYVRFKEEYGDYIYVSHDDILSCLNGTGVLNNKPCGMFAFSKEKVLRWNTEHGQTSHADKIPKDVADEYWYGTALKTTFKPIE